MVTGSTTLVGIIGFPVGHSLSPAMHNAAFRALEMDWIYVPLPVNPGRLDRAVQGLLSLGFRGANVTVPYKEKVIPYLDHVSEHAARIGAVNTITVEDGLLVGDNTDWRGFLDDIEEMGIDPSGRHAVILGSGGASRSVAYALATRGSDVTICGRNRKTTEALVNDLRNLFAGTEITSAALETFADSPTPTDILVNTTPVGMSPVTGCSPWPESIAFPRCELAYDLIYNPGTTRFMEQAAKAGARAVNGLGMLVRQAGGSFGIWTGTPPPLEVMRRAALACDR